MLVTGLLLAATALMAWVTWQAAVDFVAGPSLPGWLRLLVEGVALGVLGAGVIRRVRGGAADERGDRGRPR